MSKKSRVLKLSVPSIIEIDKEIATYMLSYSAGAAFTGMLPDVKARLKAAVIASGTDTPKTRDLDEALFSACDSDNFFKKASVDRLFDFVKRVFSHQIAANMSVYDLYQTAEDGNVSDELLKNFAKLSVNDIKLNFPEVHEYQELAVRDFEKVVADQVKSDAKAETKKQTLASMSTAEMIAALVDKGFMVTKVARATKPQDIKKGAKR